MARRDVKLIRLALAGLVLLAFVGWGVRHSIAYRIQVQRGRLAVSSIPREKLVPWLVETVANDPVAARRANGALFLQHFRDAPTAVATLLRALGDPNATVQSSAWDALDRPRCAFHYGCVSDATRAIPTEEFLTALRATRLEPARSELFEYVVYRRMECVDDALRIVIASGPFNGSGGDALYDLGWAGGFMGLLRDPAESPLRARSIAHEGLANPDPEMQRECVMFLVALGGVGLDKQDRGWVIEAGSAPGLVRDALTVLATQGGVRGRFGEPPQVEPSGALRVRTLLDAIEELFGADHAAPFARAGAGSDVLDVGLTCHRWLRDRGLEENDDPEE